LSEVEVEDSAVELFVDSKRVVVVVKAVLLVVDASSAATIGTAIKPVDE